MATIIVATTTHKEAKKVLDKVYESDRNSTYSNGKKTVSGSALSATIQSDKTVKISSGFYNEVSLREMFDN